MPAAVLGGVQDLAAAALHQLSDDGAAGVRGLPDIQISRYLGNAQIGIGVHRLLHRLGQLGGRLLLRRKALPVSRAVLHILPVRRIVGGGAGGRQNHGDHQQHHNEDAAADHHVFLILVSVSPSSGPLEGRFVIFLLIRI